MYSIKILLFSIVGLLINRATTNDWIQTITNLVSSIGVIAGNLFCSKRA